MSTQTQSTQSEGYSYTDTRADVQTGSRLSLEYCNSVKELFKSRPHTDSRSEGHSSLLRHWSVHTDTETDSYTYLQLQTEINSYFISHTLTLTETHTHSHTHTHTLVYSQTDSVLCFDQHKYIQSRSPPGRKRFTYLPIS